MMLQVAYRTDFVAAFFILSRSLREIIAAPLLRCSEEVRQSSKASALSDVSERKASARLG